MNEKQTKFELYLDEKIAACRQRCERFAADDRIDEGNFEKIRANVYEIFKTIYRFKPGTLETVDALLKTAYRLTMEH